MRRPPLRNKQRGGGAKFPPGRLAHARADDYANKMKLIYYYLLVNCTIERSVASAFIDGVLHRETSNWNHK